MANSTYLIPSTTNGHGSLILEYRIEHKKRDMRTRFCKLHEKNRITFNLESVPFYADLIRKDDRLIAPNGKIAYQFQKAISSMK